LIARQHLRARARAHAALRSACTARRTSAAREHRASPAPSRPAAARAGAAVGHIDPLEDTVKLTTPAGAPSKKAPARERNNEHDVRANASDTKSAGESTSKAGMHGESSSEGSSGEKGRAAGEHQTTAQRFMSLASGGHHKDKKGRPKYKPMTAKSLSRRRLLGDLLPYEWAKDVRHMAQQIPEQYFEYIASTLAIASSAVIGGGLAYAGWPWLRAIIIHAFSADSPEARVMQARPAHCCCALRCRRSGFLRLPRLAASHPL
jgi:hypothetical protein